MSRWQLKTHDRRSVLKALGALAAAGMTSPRALAKACEQQPVHWRNWSGAQVCLPAQRLAPASEDELASLLKTAVGTVRPVGSGHSFSALVPTDDNLLSVGRLTGLISHDAATRQATFGAGTLLSQVGGPLEAQGLALENLSDIDYQSLAGLLATSTHGTGLRFGSMSTQVAGMRLVTPSGEVIDCGETNQPEIFNAARVSLGALGVVSRVTFQCRDAFKLEEKMELRRTEDYLDDIDNLIENNDHWEMQVLTHSDYALGIWLNESDKPATGDADSEDEGGNEFVGLIETLHKYGSDFPALRRALFNAIASVVSFDHRVGRSYQIFANVRNVRFNEMEYEVPREAGPDCLREILAVIKAQNLDTWFPIEYRYVQGDDIWLSQFQGRDSASISIHQSYAMDYHSVFKVIEPIFWKYGGRPHWGKLHTLNAGALKRLYPHWQDFAAVREALDPAGKMLNGHLRSVLGA